MAHPEKPFRVLLRVETRPGMAADFERTWREVGTAVTSDPANLGQWLMRSTEEEHVYYIISDWTDEPGFRAFEHSEQHVKHRERLHPFRSGGSMATMRAVYHLPKAETAQA
ncbi:antibiotic biosynthesis monooxygenase family protein [Streptomyces sp. NRRL S-1022]|uniref:antibiotic biosynthesis monooxygenase family protein n=1 Tax=Streptomyces sp. NRRL S-1022 TaxID=1463880 RepID=UPI0004BF1B55|nr:antibiotic biosynthesis monooxygenase family protein [Streptomyces sp. NRRL S-1022]